MDNELYYICEIISRSNKYFKRNTIISIARNKLNIHHRLAEDLFTDLKKRKIIKKWKSGRYTLEKHFDERLIDIGNLLQIYEY